MVNNEDKNQDNNVVGSVGIVGCGWLGKALAKALIKKNIFVLATTSQPDNVTQLSRQFINAKQLTLPADTVTLVQHEVFAQKNLVIAITPQYRQGRKDYAEKIKQLVLAAQQKGIVQRIILLSSTAVYDGLTGVVDENSSLCLSTEKVNILHAAEQNVLTLFQQQNQQGAVIRLAGLVGPDRHPAKFLLANKTLSNSMAPVNLIHQQDAVGLIESLLQMSAAQITDGQMIVNGVSNTHVNKQTFYQAAAKALKIDAPNFKKEQATHNKRIVSGEKAKQVLNYKFVYPDLLTWL